VGAKDESDDDKTVYLHVFTTTQQARNVISHNPHPTVNKRTLSGPINNTATE